MHLLGLTGFLRPHLEAVKDTPGYKREPSTVERTRLLVHVGMCFCRGQKCQMLRAYGDESYSDFELGFQKCDLSAYLHTEQSRESTEETSEPL